MSSPSAPSKKPSQIKPGALVSVEIGDDSRRYLFGVVFAIEKDLVSLLPFQELSANFPTNWLGSTPFAFERILAQRSPLERCSYLDDIPLAELLTHENVLVRMVGEYIAEHSDADDIS